MNEAKKQYERVSKGLFFYLFGVIVLTYISLYLLKKSTGMIDYSYNDLIIWIIDIITQYIIGFPLFYLLIRKTKIERKDKQKIKVKTFFKYLLECMGVMYVGSIIGNILSLVLSGGSAVNPVEQIASSSLDIKVLVVVFVAPIIEETIFRKLLIDRTTKYGEKTAILFSALSFGLFHMNLFQFFYAFGIGLFFGYIYTKTRNIKYTIFLHIIVNFYGGILSPFILSFANEIVFDATTEMSLAQASEMLNYSLIVLAYSSLYLVLCIVGIVLVCTNMKRISFNSTENDIPKNEIFKTVFCNKYYIAFSILCLAFIIKTLI